MKILETEKTPLDIFCEASSILNKAVEHTLGPNGANTAVVTKDGRYDIINDGKSIIEGITSLDPAISPALETLKQASFETNRKAGDGTTSTTIIMNALLQGAKNWMTQYSISSTLARKILEDTKNRLIEKLNKYKTIVTEEDYSKVAEVALGSSKYADTIADIYKFLGPGKRPTIIKSDIDNIEVEKVDGISLSKIKIVSSLFVNTKEYHDLDIICLYEPVNRFQEITQLLRKVQQTGKDTILFYNQLSTDILENLLFNYSNGAIKLIPICLGGYGKDTYKLMQELADYTGCNIIDNNECKISEPSKIIFGRANYGIVNFEKMILKNEKKVEKNYVLLEEKSVIMRIGGTNVVEREEVYRRIEDAINSLGNAIEYGIVPGAGQSYKDLIYEVNKDLQIPTFIIKAMESIYNRINDTTEIKDDIYDSAMVVKEVIVNAFSIVSQVITTYVVIRENIR